MYDDSIPQDIRTTMHTIDEDAMVISGLSEFYYGLKDDVEALEEGQARQFPELTMFRKGLRDYSLVRAIGALADEICRNMETVNRWTWACDLEARQAQEAVEQAETCGEPPPPHGGSVMIRPISNPDRLARTLAALVQAYVDGLHEAARRAIWQRWRP